MIRFLELCNQTLFCYYLASNLAYLAMLLIAMKTSAAHQHKLKSYRLGWLKDSPLAPPITIVAPAHNEEKSIRASVRSLLELDYLNWKSSWSTMGRKIARSKSYGKSSASARFARCIFRSSRARG